MSERTAYILLWLIWLGFLTFMSVTFSPWWGAAVFIMHPRKSDDAAKSNTDMEDRNE